MGSKKMAMSVTMLMAALENQTAVFDMQWLLAMVWFQ